LKRKLEAWHHGHTFDTPVAERYTREIRSVSDIVTDFLAEFDWPKEFSGEYISITTDDLFDGFVDWYADKYNSETEVTQKQFQLYACKKIMMVGRARSGGNRKYYYKPLPTAD
jgi:hypothetical protein